MRSRHTPYYRKSKTMCSESQFGAFKLHWNTAATADVIGIIGKHNCNFLHQISASAAYTLYVASDWFDDAPLLGTKDPVGCEFLFCRIEQH